MKLYRGRLNLPRNCTYFKLALTVCRKVRKKLNIPEILCKLNVIGSAHLTYIKSDNNRSWCVRIRVYFFFPLTRHFTGYLPIQARSNKKFVEIDFLEFSNPRRVKIPVLSQNSSFVILSRYITNIDVSDSKWLLIHRIDLHVDNRNKKKCEFPIFLHSRKILSSILSSRWNWIETSKEIERLD